MSVRTMTAVWDLDLPDSDKLVLLALADCANDEGHCWPSVASLVRKCTKSERTIQGCIKRLVDEGHLTRREVIGKGCNYSVHPFRNGCAPATAAPPQRTTQTPAAVADKPSRTTKASEAIASSASRSKRARSSFPPPDGVEKDQWRAFRAQRKKRLNDRSYLMICNKLKVLADAGWPPGDMIDLAIERGWETVFEPMEQRHGTQSQSSLRRDRPNLTQLLRASSGNPESGFGTRPALPASGDG